MSDNGADEVVTTIFVGGFPPDARPRELDNLCRFMPGFVTSNVATSRGVTLFVLFDTPHSAQFAIKILNGQPFDRTVEGVEPLRATMARNNMRSPTGAAVAGPGQAPITPRPGAWAPTTIVPPARGSAGGPMRVPPPGRQVGPPGQPPPPQYPPPPAAQYPTEGYYGGAKRPRQEGGEIDTVASVGAAEQGWEEAALRGFFESQQGFLLFKANPRMGGGFAKFASASAAQDAIAAAAGEGIPAEMARSSMAMPGGGPPAPGGGHGRAAAPAGGGPIGKRPRMPEDQSQIDTVACVGAVENGFDETMLQEFFQGLEGFLAFRGNPRMGGGFAKFASPELASAAVSAATDIGVPAQMAKSSMATA